MEEKGPGVILGGRKPSMLFFSVGEQREFVDGTVHLEVVVTEVGNTPPDPPGIVATARIFLANKSACRALAEGLARIGAQLESREKGTVLPKFSM